MPDIPIGESVSIQGSARTPYVLKNVGGVYSCTCQAWRNQSLPIDRRSCKHLRVYLGEASEAARTGAASAPDIPAKPTSVPRLLLAETWDKEQDVTGWYMSEKLDGIRAYWDGSQFWSRQGNRFYAPAWFTAELPAMPLDGELWLGRKQFQQTVSIVRSLHAGEAWRKVAYVVFDAPAEPGPFEQRLIRANSAVWPGQTKFSRVLKHLRCRGAEHLREELDRIEVLGGEGLMLRAPGSQYVPGRSDTLLKVKRFHEADAVVVGHAPGAGRHCGRTGALLVRLPSGREFSVGSGLTDAQRDSPPAVGAVITFRYQEFTDGGVPRFPTFVRVRSDV